MTNIGRLTKLLYVLFLVGLPLIRINTAEAEDPIDTAYAHADHPRWHSDSTNTLDKFHLSFVRNVIDTLGFKSEKTHEHHSGPTNGQKYGFGFLSVLIISTFSLVGAAIFPLTRRPYYQYLNATFTSLAVGALFANVAFELLPDIIRFEGGDSKSRNRTCANETESDEDEPLVPLHLWQMLILVLTAYFFYVLEAMINVFVNYRERRRRDMYSLNEDELPSDEASSLPAPERERSDTILSATFPHYTMSPDDSQRHAIGWMIIIGDGIHNVADGLAIGAAFSESIFAGVAQSIAIGCQEFPSEIGEMMILINSGFTIRKALLFNFFSGCTAIVGFFIGVGLSSNAVVRVWIFSFTAGIFIYIALVDLWPTLMPEARTFNWIRFACVTAGYLTGVFVMFGLGVLAKKYAPDV